MAGNWTRRVLCTVLDYSEQSYNKVDRILERITDSDPLSVKYDRTFVNVAGNDILYTDFVKRCFI
jgi:hypothetical protein